jgi:hypothetical protein
VTDLSRTADRFGEQRLFIAEQQCHSPARSARNLDRPPQCSGTAAPDQPSDFVVQRAEPLDQCKGGRIVRTRAGSGRQGRQDAEARRSNRVACGCASITKTPKSRRHQEIARFRGRSMMAQPMCGSFPCLTQGVQAWGVQSTFLVPLGNFMTFVRMRSTPRALSRPMTPPLALPRKPDLASRYLPTTLPSSLSPGIPRHASLCRTQQ